MQSPLILENTPQPLEKSKQTRKQHPLGEMDYSEEGQKRNQILRQSKAWVDIDPSIPCMANGRRKGIKGVHASVKESLEERIAFYFQHVQVDHQGCWIWTKNNCCDGYGRIKWQGKDMKVNRFAWMIHFGHPGNMNVCHHCDVKLCGNPEHLFLGTQGNNMRDMRRKLRGNSVYTPSVVLRVRELRQLGMLYKDISDIVGMSKTNVGRIARGEIWGYITGQ